MLDVLLPSAYFCDLIFTGLADIPKLGDEVFAQELKVVPGAGFIPAVALTRLGVNVGWACDFGNDFFSRYVLDEAVRQRLSSHLFRMHDRSLQTVSVAYSFAGDRAFLSYIDSLPPIDLTALVSENPSHYLMLMSLQCDGDFVDAAKIAHTQGARIFMDGQVIGDANLANPGVNAALRSVDIFSVNQKEALQLTGEQNVESALMRLSEFTHTIIIKLGPDGAIARTKDSIFQVPGLPTNVVDTTGAGDNFDCGFLYGLLQDYSLEDCLRCGNFCGSRSVTAQGGWEASPTEDHLQAYLRSDK
jgi:sugar/nucleoside kinase (ribokinase family)